ncbi:MAG TPA: T9SS type A sorting domain-containing protein, partial [Saprospiraceae bacterium]|nr:T9SS type A sorting domain-containing protein [Saprospiraceae bacterium]
VKLNTPGENDGIFEFWINDSLQASSTNLNWHSTWNNNPDNLHINAIFFENYWNSGSPVVQERYFDNLVISTQAIPCDCKTTSLFSSLPKQELSISPNPARNEILLTGNPALSGINYVIRNLMGTIVKMGKFEKEREAIDIQSFIPGMYILQIQDVCVKFIKTEN